MPSTLLHSPADIISRLLINDGLGTAPGSGGAWPIHVAAEPDTPDNCITLYDAAGTDDGRSMIDGELFGHAGFQVRVRAKDHTTGWVKADAIQTHLAKGLYAENITIDGTAYFVHAITRISDVLPLGKESPVSSRRLFTINATAALR